MVIKTVDLLFEESGISIQEVAQRANLLDSRVESIIAGRWLASPQERKKIAQAFGLSVDKISWGHNMSPRNQRYHRFGVEEEF